MSWYSWGPRRSKLVFRFRYKRIGINFTTTSILDVFPSSLGADEMYVATTFLDSSTSSISNREGTFSLRGIWAMADGSAGSFYISGSIWLLGVEVEMVG
jgi:hypothetical protein